MTESEGLAHIRELDQAEIAAVLRRNHVGRIGYTRRGKIDIQPVLYVFEEGWIYGRTSYGTKYENIAQTAYQWWPVVFQVDEVEDLFRWRSVLVHGGFYVLSRDASREERESWAHALEQVRTLDPAALGDNDAVPFRTVLFRIAVQEATGRESTQPVGGG
jgi:nitroimidazol reductase NimA-like FMN-containing flavoprotein (pyridoxamine 5'-phosphate oxidase superfamily)